MFSFLFGNIFYLIYYINNKLDYQGHFVNFQCFIFVFKIKSKVSLIVTLTLDTLGSGGIFGRGLPRYALKGAAEVIYA